MRLFLLVLLLVATSLCSRAQGLVQIVFEGEIDAAGGARVESDIVIGDAGASRPQKMSLALLLGERTSAVDFAGLLARRLEQAGAHVIFTGATGPMKGPTCLFVENVLAIGLRLGHGLNATITLCDDRPSSIKLTPSIESPLGAGLTVVAQTMEAHSQQPGHFTLDVRLDDRADASDVGPQIVKAAIDKGWPSELDQHVTWRPGATTDNGDITSCSIQLRSTTDWRIDISLAPHATPR
jgi:hypothetical protein